VKDKVKWTWDYEIRDLGCWPTRPPYAGTNEPVEIVLASDYIALEAELVQVRADYDAANYLAERTSQAWRQAKAERDTLEAETRWAMKRIFAYVTEQYSSKDFMERADDLEHAKAWLAANPTPSLGDRRAALDELAREAQARGDYDPPKK
jgi:hypothetical protein